MGLDEAELFIAFQNESPRPKKVTSKSPKAGRPLPFQEMNTMVSYCYTTQPVITHLCSFSYWLPRSETITLVYYLLGPLPRFVQGPSSFHQPLDHLLPPALHADQQVLDEHHILFLTEVLQMGSSFVQFYYLLAVRIYLIGEDLSRKKKNIIRNTEKRIDFESVRLSQCSR